MDKMWSQALITVENLTCVRRGRVIFSGLDFTLAPGEALHVIGPNGCGKSSLLRVLSGLLRPVRGAVDCRGKLHYLGHLNAFKSLLSVRENLSTWAGAERNAAQEDFALSCFQLDKLSDTPAYLLSSGQGRRLALARLIAVDRPLWLLDEPSVGLDKASVAGLEQVITRHREQGGAVILTTHTPLALPRGTVLNLEDNRPTALVQDADPWF